jgi:hypothetical protein
MARNYYHRDYAPYYDDDGNTPPRSNLFSTIVIIVAIAVGVLFGIRNADAIVSWLTIPARPQAIQAYPTAYVVPPRPYTAPQPQQPVYVPQAAPQPAPQVVAPVVEPAPVPTDPPPVVIVEQAPPAPEQSGVNIHVGSDGASVSVSNAQPTPQPTHDPQPGEAGFRESFKPAPSNNAFVGCLPGRSCDPSAKPTPWPTAEGPQPGEPGFRESFK